MFIRDVIKPRDEGQNASRIPESQTYGILGLIMCQLWHILGTNDSEQNTGAQSICLHSDPFERLLAGHIDLLIQPCIDLLCTYDVSTDNMKTKELRRYTRRAWQASVDEVVHRRLAQRSWRWRIFLYA